MNKYRKIYTENYGHIPIDDDGRTYEIHHIDGNKKNNDPLNLVALSIYHHYIVHYVQGDLNAAAYIGNRIKLSPEIISRLRSKAVREKIKNGTHNFLGGKIGGENSRKRVADGTHNLLGPEHNRRMISEGKLGGEISRKIQFQRIVNGTHNLLGLREKGLHNSQQIGICPHCGIEGHMNAMPRWHFDNCKQKMEI